MELLGDRGRAKEGGGAEPGKADEAKAKGEMWMYSMAFRDHWVYVGRTTRNQGMPIRLQLNRLAKDQCDTSRG